MLKHTVQYALGEHVLALAWSPQGAALAAIGADGGVFLLDTLAAAANWRQIGRHAGGALSVAWSSDGAQLASCGQDGVVRMFDLAGSQTAALAQDERWVGQVCFSPDGRWLAAAGRRVRLWQASTLTLMHEYPAGAATVEALCFSPDSSHLAAAGYGGVRLLTFEQDAGKQITEAKPKKQLTRLLQTSRQGVTHAPFSERLLAWSGACLAAAWRPKGDVIAVGGQDASLQFWRLPRGAQSCMSGLESKVRALAWNRSGRWLANTGGAVLTLWDFKNGPEGTGPLLLYGHLARVQAIAWQRSGDLLASIASDARLLLWDPLRTAEPLSDTELASMPTRLVWAPDDQRLALGAADGSVHLFHINPA